MMITISAFRITLAVVTSLVGIVCLGAAIIGYLIHQTRIYDRILLFAAAFFLIKPGWATDIFGIICIIIIVFLQIKRKPGPRPEEAVI